MHLAEFVVRDFANVERNAEWCSVAVFDDILPRTVEEAGRDRPPASYQRSPASSTSARSARAQAEYAAAWPCVRRQRPQWQTTTSRSGPATV
jgi:hypothetical protein